MAVNPIAIRTVFCPASSDRSYPERGMGVRKGTAGGRPFVFTVGEPNSLMADT